MSDVKSSNFLFGLLLLTTEKCLFICLFVYVGLLLTHFGRSRVT